MTQNVENDGGEITMYQSGSGGTTQTITQSFSQSQWTTTTLGYVITGPPLNRVEGTPSNNSGVSEHALEHQPFRAGGTEPQYGVLKRGGGGRKGGKLVPQRRATPGDVAGRVQHERRPVLGMGAAARTRFSSPAARWAPSSTQEARRW